MNGLKPNLESFFNIGRDFNQPYVPKENSQIQDCPVAHFLWGLMLSSGSSHRYTEGIGLKGPLHLHLDLSWS